ncbi:MAG TPA: HD domain-containing protein [Bacteroidales bacterium]|nr:HD domain-containing protein [Bacteroidales bacterium]
MENIQRLYQEAIKFAAVKHKDQKFPGYDDIPYLVHVCDVAMEILAIPSHANGFDTGYAIQVALLHDTIEDTGTSYEELAVRFGKDIADGVSALTKNENLPKERRMADSLERIKKQRNEVWAVKLADRITNLQPPPRHWNSPKKKEYLSESVFILEKLKQANEYLAGRLRNMIEEYEKFV